MFITAWLEFFSKLAITTARRHHAVASSIAPAPSATVPMVVPASFLVMHMDAPRKSIASAREVVLGKRAVWSNRIQARPAPNTNGVSIPATDTAIELVNFRRTMSTRNSIPTTNM